jgi:TonB family protein
MTIALSWSHKWVGTMLLRKIISLLLMFPSVLCLASIERSNLPGNTASVADREQEVWASAKRDAEFSAVAHSSRKSCEATHPPEALATPSPLLDQANQTAKIKVSFIIGTDGRVHSPFILESGGTSEDRIILDTVRSWRYRPATCNGVPTEAEAKIGFSTR